MIPKMVYVAHPIRGDVEGNIRKIVKICRRIHTYEVIPCVPYLAVIAAIGAEEGTKEEELGLWTNHEYIERRMFDEMWLFGDCISVGMRDEIIHARKCHIPVKGKTKQTRDGLTYLARKGG